MNLRGSHEYGEQITSIDKAEIDELILRELRHVLRLSDWSIRERSHGTYAKHPALPVWGTDVADAIRVFTGTGGAGMTMSFGLGERSWDLWTGESTRPRI